MGASRARRRCLPVVRRTSTAGDNASASFNVPLANGLWQTTAAWGRNCHLQGKSFDGFLLEAAASIDDRHNFFGRLERVEKDELCAEPAPQAGQSFSVSKLSLGYIRDFTVAGHVKVGIGGLVSGFSIPGSLESTYGAHPTSYIVLARIKFD